MLIEAHENLFLILFISVSKIAIVLLKMPYVDISRIYFCILYGDFTEIYYRL